MDKISPIVWTVPEDSGNACQVLPSVLFQDVLRQKVHHMIVDAPYHVLTSLRILKTIPKKVKDIITFYVKTGAWYAHSEFLLLSLLSSPTLADRQFAISQIKKLGGNADFGDSYVRPRITPKLNLSPTLLQNLISWTPGDVQEPSFTCNLSKAKILSLETAAFVPPPFSCHA